MNKRIIDCDVSYIIIEVQFCRYFHQISFGSYSLRRHSRTVDKPGMFSDKILSETGVLQRRSDYYCTPVVAELVQRKYLQLCTIITIDDDTSCIYKVLPTILLICDILPETF